MCISNMAFLDDWGAIQSKQEGNDTCDVNCKLGTVQVKSLSNPFFDATMVSNRHYWELVLRRL